MIVGRSYRAGECQYLVCGYSPRFYRLRGGALFVAGRAEDFVTVVQEVAGVTADPWGRIVFPQIFREALRDAMTATSTPPAGDPQSLPDLVVVARDWATLWAN